MKKTELQGKKVLVFGSGISGIGAVKLLETVQADVVLYDGNESLKKEEIRAKLPKESKCEIVLGELKQELIDSLNLVVMSPGVPLDIEPVERLKAAGLPIWGEVELAYCMGDGTVLAITGTNGKTTTTALLGEIIKSYADSVFVVGNIGNAYTGAASSMKEESYTVAEISSFQLETIHSFHPKVSAILNITEDHLNRHHTMEAYIRVKELIASNQTKDDFCILNYEDEILRKYAPKLHNKIIWFSSKQELENGIYLEGKNIIYSHDGEKENITTTEDTTLVGIHNVENIMAAIGISISMGVPNDVIKKAIRKFKAVEHRIEYVTTIDDVIYYNDSKGTNTDASVKAIQAMTRPTILIAGGYDKKVSFDDWAKELKGKVKCLVLLGQTSNQIAETVRKYGFENIIFTESLEEAVEECRKNAESGDAVLLSPACASWGMFDNYEQRGNMFKELVLKK